MMFQKRWKLLLFIFLLFINMIILTLKMFTSIDLDYIVSQYVQQIASSLVYHVAFNVTKLGSSTFLVPFTIFIACVFILLYRSINKTALICSAPLITYLLNELIKIMIKRERPSILQSAHGTGYSFPSGHAMIPLVFYGFLLYYINKEISNRQFKLCITSLVTIIIALIGVSRIILNVHYLSDVISGFLFGFILLQLFIKIDKHVV